MGRSSERSAGPDVASDLGRRVGASYSLRVERGAHAGVEIALAEGLVRVGDALDADVFLADADGELLELELSPGRIARAGEVDEDDEAVVRRFTLGAAAVVVTAPPAAAATAATADADAAAPARAQSGWAARLGLRAAAVLGLGALGVAAISLVAPNADQPPPPQAAAADPVREWLAAVAPTLSGAGFGPNGYRVEGFAADAAIGPLQTRFQDAFGDRRLDLTGVLTPRRIEAALRRRLSDSDAGGGVALATSVGVDGAAILTATGALPADAYAFWGDVQTWFERRYGAHARLVSQVSSRDADPGPAPKVALEAVWVGADPYIVTADGRRTRAGETLPSGWIVAEISERAVVFERAGATHIVELPAAANGEGGR